MYLLKLVLVSGRRPDFPSILSIFSSARFQGSNIGWWNPRLLLAVMIDLIKALVPSDSLLVILC